MSRGFYVFGEFICLVRGGVFSSLTELGLTSEPVEVAPRFTHKDIHVDDYGGEIPADVMSMLMECEVRTTLVHYDVAVLAACMGESLGNSLGLDGTCGPAGQMMGGGKARFASGNHFISLNLLSAVPGNAPWRFRSCYLKDRQSIPLGSEKTLAALTWRALPYTPPVSSTGEVISANSVVFDHILDS